MPDGMSMVAESLPVFSDEDMFRARLAVCAAAKNKEEAVMFLEMLGLK
jgi:hypothetical protein